VNDCFSEDCLINNDFDSEFSMSSHAAGKAPREKLERKLIQEKKRGISATLISLLNPNRFSIPL
jgi:hypothetical protein